MIIIGKNAKLRTETNDEVRAALNGGKLVRSFPSLLHEIHRRQQWKSRSVWTLLQPLLLRGLAFFITTRIEMQGLPFTPAL